MDYKKFKQALAIQKDSRQKKIIYNPQQFLSDNAKIKVLKAERYSLSYDDRALIIENLRRDDKKIECIKDDEISLESEDISSVIQSFKSDDKKIECLIDDNISLKSEDISSVIQSFKSDDKKIEYLRDNKNLLKSEDAYNIIEHISDDDKKIEYLIDNRLSFKLREMCSIIQSLRSDDKKVECLTDNRLSLTSGEMCSIIQNLRSDDKKIECLIDDRLSLTSVEMCSIIQNLRSDDKKIECLRENKIPFGLWEILFIVESLSDDNKKIECLIDDKIPLDKMFIPSIIISLNNDDEKIKWLEEFLKDDKISFKSDDISSVIKSFKSDDKKIKCLIDNRLSLGPKEIYYIIESLNNDDIKIECLRECLKIDENLLETSDICSIIGNLSNNLLKLQCANNNIFNLNNENITTILNHINNLPELIFNTEVSDELLKTVLSTPSCLRLISFGLNDITENASKELYDELNKLVKTIEPGKSISNLLAILSVQAKENFNERKVNEPNKYLPSNIAEIIVGEIGNKTKNEIQEDDNLNRKKKELTKIINESFDITALSSVLEQINKDKSNKNLLQIINQILDTLNIRVLIDKDGNIDGELKNEYTKILESFVEPSIEEMINSGNANEILNMIKNATELIVNVSFNEKSNRKIGGLLTKVCTLSLDAQQKSATSEIFDELKNAAKEDLILTKKSLEKIYKNRMLNIFKEDIEFEKILNDENINFPNKINMILYALYPNYNGEKNLQQLYLLMKEDIRYKNRLSKQITKEEKLELPLSKENFEINEGLQKQRVIMAILNILNINMLPSINENGYLSDSIIKRINEIANGIKDRNTNGGDAKGIELLCSNLSNLTNKESMGYLLIFYRKITKTLKDDAKFNIDNLNKYVENAKKMATISNEKKVILGDLVCDKLDNTAINSNFLHYTQNMSRRTYRTIPNISGKVDSNDSEIQFRSYNVDDPEQLIAGTRITTLDSCFRIGGFQNDTIEYVTSSPHGTIIAVEDKNNNFLGRVYGYRIGNAVHFTRIYYNEEFDFEKVITQIGQSIIEKSNEIEYVTVIPETCLNKQYICNQNEVDLSKINLTQEGYTIVTDHRGSQTPILIASKNKQKIIVNRNEPNEKFYKERKMPEFCDLKFTTENKNFEIEKKLEKISILNGEEEHNYFITDNSKVVIGDGWFIIISDENSEPVIKRIHYNDEIIDKIISDEIQNSLIKIKQKIINKESNEQLLETPQIDERRVK